MVTSSNWDINSVSSNQNSPSATLDWRSKAETRSTELQPAPLQRQKETEWETLLFLITDLKAHFSIWIYANWMQYLTQSKIQQNFIWGQHLYTKGQL